MATISGEIRDENDDLLADCVVRAYRRDTGAWLVSGITGDGSPELTGDTDYASVTLLLHFDGTDGSTTITDSGPSARTVTVAGNAHIEVDQSKFGGASAAFDGTGDYLTSASNAAFNLNDGNWTVETWAYMTATPTTGPSFCSRRTTGTNGWSMEADALRGYINGAWSDSHIAWTRPSLNAWHHYAYVKNGTTITVYVDGTSVGSKTSVTSIQDQTESLRLGVSNNSGENPLTGYLDDFRFTKGVARYTANFTAPTMVFPEATIPAKPLGEYTLTTSYTDEVQVIALDPAGGTTFNDLILRTTPV